VVNKLSPISHGRHIVALHSTKHCLNKKLQIFRRSITTQNFKKVDHVTLASLSNMVRGRG